MQFAAPLLRWAGSKKRQYAKLEPYFPSQFKTYVEPFAGSAAFLFRLNPKRAIINDINRDVIDFYCFSTLEAKRFYNAFASIPRDKDHYYDCRIHFNSLPSSFERSVLFYYLNRNCFNGIYRVNKSGFFNVPFSNYRVAPYLSFDEFSDSIDIVSKHKFTNMDFEECCNRFATPASFVYLDPPYYDETRRIFAEYNVANFGSEDFERLAQTLRRLDRKGVQFLVSYPRTKPALELASKWRNKRVKVIRSIAGDAKLRSSTTELLIYNYDL